jgi:hypothetical protein
MTWALSEKMVRAVERKGTVVEFTNIIGAFVGRTYRYKFPNEQGAKKFEQLAKDTDAHGVPSSIDSVKWGRYRIG